MFSELPVVSVHIPPSLRTLTGGSSEVMASGETVFQVLEAVGHQYPRWLAHVLGPQGELKDGVAVFLGGEQVSDLLMPLGQEECLNVLLAGDVLVVVGGAVPHCPPPEHAISIGD